MLRSKVVSLYFSCTGLIITLLGCTFTQTEAASSGTTTSKSGSPADKSEYSYIKKATAFSDGYENANKLLLEELDSAVKATRIGLVNYHFLGEDSHSDLDFSSFVCSVPSFSKARNSLNQLDAFKSGLIGQAVAPPDGFLALLFDTFQPKLSEKRSLSPDEFNALQRDLKSKNNEARVNALEQLGELGTPAEVAQVFNDFVSAISDSNTDVRLAASLSASRIKKRFTLIPPSNTNAKEVIQIVDSLEHNKVDEIVANLIATLKTQNRSAAKAVDALAVFPTAEALNALLETFVRPEPNDPSIRQNIQQALTTAGNVSVPFIKLYLVDPAVEARATQTSLVNVLGRIPGRDSCKTAVEYRLRASLRGIRDQTVRVETPLSETISLTIDLLTMLKDAAKGILSIINEKEREAAVKTYIRDTKDQISYVLKSLQGGDFEEAFERHRNSTLSLPYFEYLQLRKIDVEKLQPLLKKISQKASQLKVAEATPSQKRAQSLSQMRTELEQLRSAYSSYGTDVLSQALKVHADLDEYQRLSSKEGPASIVEAMAKAHQKLLDYAEGKLEENEGLAIFQMFADEMKALYDKSVEAEQRIEKFKKDTKK